MRTGGASLFPLALLGMLAALTFWLEQATQPGAGRTDGKQRHDPDFVVDNLKMRRFGPDGTLQHSLVAQRMKHFPDDDSTDVELPRVTYHRNPPTLITADNAKVGENGTQVRLEGNVQVVRAGLAGQPSTIVATPVLNVAPDDEIAHTDAPVTITRGRSIITGVGARVDNKAQTAVLSGPVRGTIHKNTPAAPAAPNIEHIQHVIPSPAARPASVPAAQPATRPSMRAQPRARGKGRQGKAGQPRS